MCLRQGTSQCVWNSESRMKRMPNLWRYKAAPIPFLWLIYNKYSKYFPDPVPLSPLPLFFRPSLHCPIKIKLKGQITLLCLSVTVMYSVSMVVQEVLSSPNKPMQLYCTTSRTQSFMMRWWMGCDIYFIGGQARSNIPYRQTGIQNLNLKKVLGFWKMVNKNVMVLSSGFAKTCTNNLSTAVSRTKRGTN